MKIVELVPISHLAVNFDLENANKSDYNSEQSDNSIGSPPSEERPCITRYLYEAATFFCVFGGFTFIFLFGFGFWRLHRYLLALTCVVVGTLFFMLAMRLGQDYADEPINCSTPPEEFSEELHLIEEQCPDFAADIAELASAREREQAIVAESVIQVEKRARETALREVCEKLNAIASEKELNAGNPEAIPEYSNALLSDAIVLRSASREISRLFLALLDAPGSPSPRLYTEAEVTERVRECGDWFLNWCDRAGVKVEESAIRQGLEYRAKEAGRT